MKSVDKRHNSRSNEENNEDSSEFANHPKHSRANFSDNNASELSSSNQNNEKMNVDNNTGIIIRKSTSTNNDGTNAGTSSYTALTTSRSGVASSRSASLIPNRNTNSFGRMRSRSTTSYRESGSQLMFVTPRNEARIDETTRLSDSLRSAIQMSHNIAQVFPNLNNISLPDYLPQMPNISIPSIAMPTISMPTISMPSMPNLSMPNISMPSMNINIPSISGIMSKFLVNLVHQILPLFLFVRFSKEEH